MQTPLLEVKNLDVHFGPTKVIHNINLTLNKNEILIIMGPNGAGKTVLLKSIFGLLPKSAGEIIFQGKMIHPSPAKMVTEGVAFVGQGKRIFPSLSIEDNLKMGAFLWKDENMLNKRIAELIDFFPILKKKLKTAAFNMSGGEQQILSLARALMMNPKLLILDEPSIGLAPKTVQDVFEKIAEINKTFQTSIIIVEHNLKSLLNIAQRGYILAEGKIVLEGPIEKLSDSRTLEQVFFGTL